MFRRCRHRKNLATAAVHESRAAAKREPLLRTFGTLENGPRPFPVLAVGGVGGGVVEAMSSECLLWYLVMIKLSMRRLVG